jgi:uncharacterized repeat protein (TIGR03803 family)
MHRKTLRYSARAILSIFTWIYVLLGLTDGAFAATEKVLHSFDLSDGAKLYSGLIFDSQGNLYGTTFEGGASGKGRGTVFELSPTSGGSWKETVLYSFTGGQDGRNPSSSVIFDEQGNLYGVTDYGGANDFGTVFKLTPGSGGKWTETVLHSFAGDRDGETPNGQLVFDSNGNLYGTTTNGGVPSSLGTVFKLTPVGGKGWKESIVHRFKGSKDGAYPVGVIFDVVGNLYGTTTSGGSTGCVVGCGTVFKMTPNANDSWTEHILYRFKGGTHGSGPTQVVFDPAGNLYGTTLEGGNSGCGGFGCGTVFELSPESEGGWKAQLIHEFKGADGAQPFGGLVLDGAGNLYGTTFEGGAGCGSTGCGTVFELKESGGKWREIVLHRFAPRQGDGSAPVAEPILDTAGNLYGTTSEGGPFNFGTVFEVTP